MLANRELLPAGRLVELLHARPAHDELRAAAVRRFDPAVVGEALERRERRTRSAEVHSRRTAEAALGLHEALELAPSLVAFAHAQQRIVRLRPCDHRAGTE